MPGFRQKMDIDNEQFITLLRSALHYLYDHDQLRRSPLAAMFDISNRVDTPVALQKILIDAIEGIQPDESDPSQARGWLYHDVLYFRYVRGYERQAVAAQLGISERQLSRDQRAALETLAQFLWKKFNLEQQTISLPASDLVNEEPTAAPPGAAAWVDELPADRPAAWKPALLSLLELLKPLRTQHQVTFVYDPEENIPDLQVPQNALRHSLLNILSVMIPMASGATITLVPGIQGRLLTIAASIHFPAQSISPEMPKFTQHPNLEVARQFLERVGGVLSIVEQPGHVAAAFSIPAPAQIPVLVIDDNPDTIQLFQRYAQGSRYAVIGASSPLEALRKIPTIQPRIILMDVMMPEMDGWELLSRLRQDRQTQNAAILICSILPQADLAHSLGADGFLQKPVLPQDFLAALDQQMGDLEGFR